MSARAEFALLLAGWALVFVGSATWLFLTFS